MNIDLKISEVVRSMVGQVREAAPVAAASDKRPAFDGQAKADGSARQGAPAPSIDEVTSVASEMQAHFKHLNTDLKIEVDRREDTVVVKILDSETNDIIRQVPAEEIMAIRERMKELIGLLYDVET